MRFFSPLLLLVFLTGCPPKKDPVEDGDTGDSSEVDSEDCPEGEDADGDGSRSCVDCDDDNSAVHPGASEYCDGLDNDCDRSADEEAVDATTWYTDADGDGYGDDATAVTSCEAPVGTIAVGGDCNDADPKIFPTAPETDCADPIDYNCDGSTGYDDVDGDGYAACEDCNDAVAAINPEGTEVCDTRDLDEDCNGFADNDDIQRTGVIPEGTRSYYPDADGDTYGDGTSEQWCDQPVGYTSKDGDCNDTNALVNPGEVETCSTLDIDDNCDGDTEMAPDAPSWYPDRDSDGYGAEGAEQIQCTAPTGWIADGSDCDDGRSGVNPGETEVCDPDDIDEDCSGSADDADGLDCSADADSDGYAIEDGDCDDADAGVNPGESELNTVADEDCDGNPFQNATLTTLSGALVTIVSTDNALDNESATLTTSTGAATTGRWFEVSDRAGTNTIADLGPYAYTWSATGGLAGGVYNALTLYPGDAAWSPCDEEIAVALTASTGTEYVVAFTARNTGPTSNDIAIYVDSILLGTATIAPSDEEFVVAGTFVAASGAPILSLCTGTVQGGVDATQFGVFPVR